MGWQLLPKTRIGRSTAFSQAFPPSGTEQHEEHQSPVTATTYAAACRSVPQPAKPQNGRGGIRQISHSPGETAIADGDDALSDAHSDQPHQKELGASELARRIAALPPEAVEALRLLFRNR